MDNFPEWPPPQPPTNARLWLLSILLVFAVAIFLISLGVLAFGHEAPSGWQYPDDCCGGHHCHPVPCEQLSEDKLGNVHWKDLQFAYTQIRMSGDASCHVCHGWSDGKPVAPMCVFLLPMT